MQNDPDDEPRIAYGDRRLETCNPSEELRLVTRARVLACQGLEAAESAEKAQRMQIRVAL